MVNAKTTTLAWLWTALRRSRRSLAISSSCLASGGIILAADPLLLRWLFDEAVPRRDIVMAGWILGGLGLVHGSYLGLYLIGRTWETRGCEQVANHLRLRILRRVQCISSASYDAVPVGDWYHRLQLDVDNVCETLKLGLRHVVLFCAGSLASLIVMWSIDWRLTICLVATIPVVYLTHSLVRPKLMYANETVAREEAGASAFLHEHLSAARQIKLLTAEQQQLHQYREHLAAVTRARVRRTTVQMVSTVATGALLHFSTIVGLGVGTLVVIQGHGTVGTLVAFYSCAIRILVPIELLAELWASLPRLRTGLNRLRYVHELPTTSWQPPIGGPMMITRRRTGLHIHDVVFGYGAGTQVLRGLSLNVSDGETIALAGASGCGKSTLASLIVRLHDSKQGTISIDGRPVTSLRLKELRTLVALVPQEPVFFSLTVRENLLLANPRATHAALIEALELAQLEAVVRRFAVGLEQLLGKSATALSGGERQRLALARAILRRPRILILDEFTSAMDPATEHAVLSGLRSFARDRIVISIAHRRSVAHWASRIAVIHEGRIVASGPHATLYRSSGVYRELYDREWPPESPSTVESSSSEAGVPRRLHFEPQDGAQARVRRPRVEERTRSSGACRGQG